MSESFKIFAETQQVGRWTWRWQVCEPGLFETISQPYAIRQGHRFGRKRALATAHRVMWRHIRREMRKLDREATRERIDP